MIRKMGKLFLPVLLCALVLLCGSPAKATEERDVLRLPSELKIIEEKAFFENTSLDEVVLPEGILKIEYNAFKNSTNLSKVNIPSTCTYLAYGVFANCNKVESVFIPLECQLQVTSGSTGNTAFDGWTKEQKIYVEADLFDISGFWGEVASSSGFARYFTGNNATFVFNYVPENIN